MTKLSAENSSSDSNACSTGPVHRSFTRLRHCELRFDLRCPWAFENWAAVLLLHARRSCTCTHSRRHLDTMYSRNHTGQKRLKQMDGLLEAEIADAQRTTQSVSGGVPVEV
jgi:hypothetical protein